MKGSWKIARLWGVDVHLHLTFLLWLVVVAYEGGLDERDYEGALAAVGGFLALFMCVLFHEYGHALAARRYGIRTRDITLTPLGGVARLDRIPSKPMEELVVALCGPLVNVVIAAALILGLALGGRTLAIRGWMNLSAIPQKLVWVNLGLVVFNMMPAFPMDGGRVLRALLATRMGRARATRIAAVVGKVMASAFIGWGLYDREWTLALIGFFIWRSGSAEAAVTEVQSLVEDVPVRQAMMTRFHALAPSDTLDRAAALSAAGFHHDFPVLEGDRLVGSLTQSGLASALPAVGGSARVEQVMHPGMPAIASHLSVREALVSLHASGSPMVAVYEGPALAGVATRESLRLYLEASGVIPRRPPPVLGR